MKIKIISLITGISAIVFVSLGLATTVSANASYFMVPVSTSATYGATATTSTTAIGIGTGTTTLTVDSFDVGQYMNGSTFATDRATLLVNAISSSSLSVLNIAIQYSQDGVNWYGNTLSTTTTAGTISIASPVTYQLPGNSVSSTTASALLIQTPTRFYRAVFTDTGATTTIWAEFVPERMQQVND